MLTIKKTLQELNLIDSFLFSSCTEDNKHAAFIAKLIIERTTGHTIDKIIIESEKQLKGLNINKRGIRMDLFVSELADNRIARVYDIEPNTYVNKDLFFRNRYYQALVDVKKLNTRDKFNKLPNFISIWILSYDPFGQNKMFYNFEKIVEQDGDVWYNDGTAKIFLYTGGELGGSKELKALLDFIQDTRECNATDAELKQLLEIVNQIKNDEKVGVQYMLFKDDIDYERENAHEEGLAEGLVKGIISTMRDFNASDEQIIAYLVKKCNLSEDEARKKLQCNS